MIKAIILDRDGVLINSEQANIESGIYALKKLGIKTSREDKDIIVGRHPKDFMRDLSKRHKFDKEKFQEIKREKYYSLINNISVAPTIKDLIKTIKSENLLLGLTTSSRRVGTIKLLKDNQLIEYFDAIITFDESSKRKPHPEPYLKTIEKLNISPEECLIIEDTPVGVESAMNTGANVFILDQPYNKSVKKVKRIKDLQEILDVL